MSGLITTVRRSRNRREELRSAPPAIPAQDDPDRRLVTLGRERLAGMWGTGASVREMEAALRAIGCTERQVGYLIAERRAVDRISAAGLDPSVVRPLTDELLGLR